MKFASAIKQKTIKRRLRKSRQIQSSPSVKYPSFHLCLDSHQLNGAYQCLRQGIWKKLRAKQRNCPLRENHHARWRQNELTRWWKTLATWSRRWNSTRVRRPVARSTTWNTNCAFKSRQTSTWRRVSMLTRKARRSYKMHSSDLSLSGSSKRKTTSAESKSWPARIEGWRARSISVKNSTHCRPRSCRTPSLWRSSMRMSSRRPCDKKTW